MVDIGKRPAQWDSKARQVLAADSHRPLEQAEKPISLLKGLLRPTKKTLAIVGGRPGRPLLSSRTVRAHSRGHQFVTRHPKASAISLLPWLLRLVPAGAVAGWGLHPLEYAALSRRTLTGPLTPAFSQ
jgi:hypothetical protein